MDYSKDYNNLPSNEDQCYQCDGTMRVMYWWKFGARGEPTGDIECDSCGVIEQNALDTHWFNKFIPNI